MTNVKVCRSHEIKGDWVSHSTAAVVVAVARSIRTFRKWRRRRGEGKRENFIEEEGETRLESFLSII